MKARCRGWCAALAAAVLGCAGPSVQRASGPGTAGGGPSWEDAVRAASSRLEALQRRGPAPAEAAPGTAELERRYEELLARPGTPPERKPDLLLRLAELAYRDEEAAVRRAYEEGPDAQSPPGQRYRRSIALYERLASRYPDTPQALTAWYNLGYLYAEEGDPGRAAQAYAEVLRRDPASPYADEIHMRLGEAAFEAGELERAVAHYGTVVEADRPEYVDKARYKLGWCYYNLEDYPRAVEAFAGVLTRGEPSAEDLRGESVEILARAFAEWEGVPRVRAFLERHPEIADFGARLFLRLGDVYRESSRYPEAVAAYETGADLYPEALECLAMEQGIVQALRALRDPDGVAARRESWIDRYGPGSAWDRAHAGQPAAARRDALVEEGLRLAARHHHAAAQKGGAGLDRAIRLYGRYAETFGMDSRHGPEMAFLFAQALKEAGRLVEAAERFRAVAFSAGETARREEASYKRIEVLGRAYRDDPELLEALVQAHEDYVALNPSSPQAPRVRLAQGDLLFRAGRVDEARSVFERLVRDYPDRRQAPEALEYVARCHYRLEDFSAAERAARRAVELGGKTPAGRKAAQLLALSLFKQGEAAEAQGDRERAIRHFRRLAEELPRDEVAPLALGRIAGNLLALDRRREAAETWEELARRYRGTAHARQALAQAARLFAALGEWSQAAGSLETLYRSESGAGDAADILLEAAEARRSGGEPGEAARLFAEFAERFSSDRRVARARFRQAELLEAAGRDEEARRAYEAAWSARAPGEEEVYRAQAALALGRAALEEVRAVTLTGDLEAALARKEALLEQALVQLSRAAGLPYAQTFTEALFLAGQAFEHMKQALLESERPPGLTAEEREEYDFLLEERAFPLEERAVSYYRRGVAAAVAAGVYTPWVGRMFQRLESLAPWAYRRPEEPALAWDAPAPAPVPGLEALP
ncbi:MAG: tetratricopeptide repeat protein [Deferrisomatales bacterium]